MKKLLVLSAVVLGTAVASQAGVSVHLGIGLPLPPLPGAIVIGRPASPPVVVAPAPEYYPPAPVAQCPAPAPVIVAPPVCAPPVVYAPPPVVYAPAPVVVEPRIVRPNRHVVYYNGRAYRGHEWEYIHHHR